jgi:hypothetical protein
MRAFSLWEKVAEGRMSHFRQQAVWFQKGSWKKALSPRRGDRSLARGSAAALPLEHYHGILAPRPGCEELFDIYQVCRALRSTPGSNSEHRSAVLTRTKSSSLKGLCYPALTRPSATLSRRERAREKTGLDFFTTSRLPTIFGPVEFHRYPLTKIQRDCIRYGRRECWR